jgi:hypothetical protein
MSGVNRNVLTNTAIPVMGEGVTNVELITTSGSRFVILNFPPTFLSSSNGGSCTGITLQWTPDPSFGFETSSAYYAVTESILSCGAYSLNPLTASIAYEQFINSSYTSATTYYIRAFQNKVGGGRGPYSDIVSLQTRFDASEGPTYTFDTENYDPINNLWYGGSSSGSVGYVGAWTGSTMPEVIKYGGPNFDAIRTYGATLTIPMAGNTLGGVGWQASIGIAKGTATFFANGPISMQVVATTSSLGTNGENLVNAQSPGWMKSGINTFNTVVAFDGGGGSLGSRNGIMTVDNVDATTGGIGFQNGKSYTTVEGSGPYAQTNITIATSADCILRCFSVGSRYNPTNFHTKYGPAGQLYPPVQIAVTGSSVLPIASASVVNLYSDFGYPTTIAYNDLVLTTSSLNPTNDANFSYVITNSGSGWYDMNQIASKLIQVTGSLITGSTLGLRFNGTTDNLTILSSSLAGMAGKDYTVQFIGTLPGTSSQLNALFGNPDYTGNNNEDVVYRNNGIPASASIDFRTNLTPVSVNRYTIPNINTSSLQLLTFMNSGSTFKVYNGLTQLPATTIGGGVPNFTGSFNLFDNMTVNGRGIYFGYNNDVDTDNYSGSLHNLLIYSRSLSDAELSSSFQYFQTL